ncbi:MAG: hypothetical protein B6U85_08290 [Desulfurococcales archaeon ex4484_42]|nr:MAG: hypothetical protein B6U85_08290 [Desulfurococcales archaeon ex4484_42]
MPKGEIVEYLRDLGIKGCMYYHTIPSTTVLGGHGNPRSDSYGFYVDNALNPSLLALVVSSRGFSGNMTWKVALNEVTLTREFKPQTIVEIDDRVYAVQVFDISNITRSSGMYNLRIVCEAAEPISINSVFILGALKSGNISATLSVGVGVLAVKPGETVSLKLRQKKSIRNSLLLIYDLPSRRAKIKLGVGGKELSISGKVGTYELLLEDVDADEIRVMHEQSQLPYYPKYFKIYGLLTYSTSIKGPDVEVKDITISEDGKMHVTLTNTGDVSAINVLLVGTHMGEVVFRDIIKEIKPQTVIERTYRVKPKYDNTLVRLIYQGLNGQVVKTFRVKI